MGSRKGNPYGQHPCNRRERKRLKRQRKGDSPEKLEERHTPKRAAVDMWLKSGGVDRESRFKQ